MPNVIFNLYGTLIDIKTIENKNSFWKKLHSEFSYLTTSSYKELRDNFDKAIKEKEKYRKEYNIIQVFKTILNCSTQTASDVAMKYRELSIKKLELYDGVIDLLTELKGRGLKLYIISNAQSIFARKEMDELGITKFFDEIALSSEYELKKPYVEYTMKAVENFKIMPKFSIMVGNNVTIDLLPAKAMGIKQIYVKTNQSPKGFYRDEIKGFNTLEIKNRIYDIFRMPKEVVKKEEAVNEVESDASSTEVEEKDEN